ncbi:hypothetical protein SP21_62 [Salmonella phage 21]|nr:hypothetical protein SP21_62 [Salmonella phage 21]
MTPRNAKHFIHFADEDAPAMSAGLQGFIRIGSQIRTCSTENSVKRPKESSNCRL